MDIECSIALSDTKFYDLLKDFVESGMISIKSEKTIKFHNELDIEFNKSTKELLLVMRKN